MIANGLHADIQLCRDLIVIRTLRHEFEQIALPRREFRKTIVQGAAAKILPGDAFLFGTLELNPSSFSPSIQKPVIPLP